LKPSSGYGSMDHDRSRQGKRAGFPSACKSSHDEQPPLLDRPQSVSGKTKEGKDYSSTRVRVHTQSQRLEYSPCHGYSWTQSLAGRKSTSRFPHRTHVSPAEHRRRAERSDPSRQARLVECSYSRPEVRTCTRRSRGPSLAIHGPPSSSSLRGHLLVRLLPDRERGGSSTR